MRTLEFKIQGNDCRIYFGGGIIDKSGDLLSAYRGRKCAVISDERVATLYAGRLIRSLESAGMFPSLIEIPEGEGAKSRDVLFSVYDRMLELGMDRSTPVIALGGGVAGDLAGFAAATYMRGCPLMQVPTTLLAQVDSSVGGKTAVNLDGGKNLVGAFYQPGIVIADSGTLRTLEPRQMTAGAAEVIKYALICDADMFESFETRGFYADDGIIMRCCEHKAGITARDPFDNGERMKLNFGHTFGHALEVSAGYGQYLHGEAVAIGMAEAARWGEALGVTPRGTVGRIIDVLRSAGAPVEAPGELRERAYRELSKDKKSRGGVISAVLLERVGSAVIKELSTERLVSLSGG